MTTERKVEPKPQDKPKARPEAVFVTETREGEKLNVFLAFIHSDVRQLSSDIEIYLINDDNYFLDFTWFGCGNPSLFYHDTVEPQTTLHLATVSMTDLQDIERQRFQAIAYKSKQFVAKPSIDITLSVNCSKFYKLHAFTDNDYFDTPAMIQTIMRNDEYDIPVDLSMLQDVTFDKERNTHEHKPIARKSNSQNAEEVVDLHMAELLDNTNGMSNADMLNYQLDKFREVMDAHLKHKGKHIIFIHGKGNGVLRKAIEKELRTRYRTCYFQDASFQEYGFGATKVTIK